MGCGGNLLQRSIQHLLVIPGLRCAEGLAGKVDEVGGGEAGKDQLPGAESLIFQLKLPVGGVVAVFAVAQDGAADACHVGTDLVGAAGDEPDLEHCLLYTSPSPRDRQKSRMPSSA